MSGDPSDLIIFVPVSRSRVAQSQYGSGLVGSGLKVSHSHFMSCSFLPSCCCGYVIEFQLLTVFCVLLNSCSLFIYI